MVAFSRQPHRIKKSMPIHKSRFFWIGLITLLVLSILIYILFFSSFFQVKKIEIFGNQNVSTAVIEETVFEKITRHLFFLSTRSIFLADTEAAGETLLSEQPRLRKVEFKRILPDQLKITVQERKPEAVFINNQQKFLMSKQGIIFERVSDSEINFTIKNSILEDKPKLGKQVFNKEQINKILTIKSELKEIALAKAELVSTSRLDVTTEKGWQIYFNLDKDLEWQITKLKLVLEQEITESERKNLDYVDLRFQKVYYK